MAKSVGVPDPVYQRAQDVAEEHDYNLKEAIRHMCREGGYDV